MTWQNLTQAWGLSAELHTFHPSASDNDLRLAEGLLHSRFPEELGQLYHFSNGAHLLHGNLRIWPLGDKTVCLTEPLVNPFRPNDRKSEFTTLGIVSQARKLRESGWPIPVEVLVFGDNGSDDLFGIWTPETTNPAFRHPVVEIGMASDDRCMAVVGTSLLRFLTSRTAYYLTTLEAPFTALDALDVPASLRGRKSDDSLLADVFKWSDANLPDYRPDPYERGHDVIEIADLFNSGR